MTKIVTVDGLERHAIYRDPTGIECDGCGKIFRKKVNGTTFRNPHIRYDSMIAGWLNLGDLDYCVECAKEKLI